MSDDSDAYDAKVARSFWPQQIHYISEQISALKNIDVWDGEIVLAMDGLVLCTLWYNTEVEEWCVDPTRHGERT